MLTFSQGSVVKDMCVKCGNIYDAQASKNYYPNLPKTIGNSSK